MLERAKPLLSGIMGTGSALSMVDRPKCVGGRKLIEEQAIVASMPHRESAFAHLRLVSRSLVRSGMGMGHGESSSSYGLTRARWHSGMLMAIPGSCARKETSPKGGPPGSGRAIPSNAPD